MMSRSKNREPYSSFLARLLGVLLFLGLLFTPVSLIERVVETEVQAVQSAFGNTPFWVLSEAGLDARSWANLHKELEEELRRELARESFQGNLESSLSESIGDFFVNRSLAAINFFFFWSLRASVILVSLLIFLPALLASLYIGQMERRREKLTFSFSSPFQLGLCSWIWKTLWLLTAIAFIIPVSLTPHVLAVLIACLALHSGSVLHRMQKKI